MHFQRALRDSASLSPVRVIGHRALPLLLLWFCGFRITPACNIAISTPFTYFCAINAHDALFFVLSVQIVAVSVNGKRTWNAFANILIPKTTFTSYRTAYLSCGLIDPSSAENRVNKETCEYRHTDKQRL